MRRRLSLVASLVVALFAGSLFAQEEGFGGEKAAGEGDAAGETPPPADAPETYVVQPGDTLWDLSQRFLNNPWYWPRIWSYNPELDNPNWIQPGSVIRFYPGGPAAPVEVQPTPVEGGEIAEDLSGALDEGDLELGEFEDIPAFELARGIQKTLDIIPPPNTATMRRVFFVSDDRVEGAGRIKNAPEEKVLLSIFDKVYLDLAQRPGVGDLLQVFRVVRDVKHPVTGENLGKLVEVVGRVKVAAVSDGQHLAVLTDSWDQVTRGDLVGNIASLELSSVEPTPNGREVQGYVVESARYPIAHLGEGHVVLLDRGQRDGVQIGNTFTVVRAGDPYTGEVRGMADEDIAQVMVLDVSTKASTGVVLYSNREVLPGDRIEMRPEK